MINFACPNCREAYSVPESTAGEKRPCRACGQRLKVPSPPRNRTVLGELLPGPSPAHSSPPPIPSPALPPVLPTDEPSRADPDRERRFQMCERVHRWYEWWLTAVWSCAGMALLCGVAVAIAGVQVRPSLAARPEQPELNANQVTFVVCVGGVAGVALLLFLVGERGKRSACPECKTWWGRELRDRYVIDRRKAMKTVTRHDSISGSSSVPDGSLGGTRFVPFSGTVSRQEQVMVLLVTFEEKWRCVCCGHRWRTTSHAEHQDFDLD